MAWELGEAGPGEEALLSIRPHEAVITGEAGPNCFPGTVMRHTYLGAQRDYLVDLGDAVLRVVAPLEVRAKPGETVHVHLPAARVRALAR